MMAHHRRNYYALVNHLSSFKLLFSLITIISTVLYISSRFRVHYYVKSINDNYLNATIKYLDKFDREFEHEFKMNPPDVHHTARFNRDNFIVPNVVHYVQMGDHTVHFIWFVCMLSLIRNHKPEMIIIHCDCDTLHGKYWTKLISSTNVPILIRRIQVPKFVFGKPLAQIFHTGDVVRLRVLLQFGGIYLDNDVFVVNSLNKYRHFEFVLGMESSNYIGSQALFAEKNSTFLRLHYDSYHDYDGTQWYFNAGRLPVLRYLSAYPKLVKAEINRFFLAWPACVITMFTKSLSADEFGQKYDLVHVNHRMRTKFINDNIIDFNEDNIQSYDKTFGALASNETECKYLAQHLWNKWHTSDILRLQALMEFGGIYLDQDVFVLTSLNDYRHYEMAKGMKNDTTLGNQVILAEMKATFLRFYYESYHVYDGFQWYYIGVRLKVFKGLKYLKRYPNLVHIQHKRFMSAFPNMDYLSFAESYLEGVAKNYYLVHVNNRGRILRKIGNQWMFDEHSIQDYKPSFGAMARSVLNSSTIFT